MDQTDEDEETVRTVLRLIHEKQLKVRVYTKERLHAKAYLFDYVAGNPPWVNWGSLPEDYRERTRPFWTRYGLTAESQDGPRLGSVKVDISALMTYVAMQEYLKTRGTLGFVITQSVFKAAGAGRGFRSFTFRDGTPIRVVYVDDMVELKPFEGAANRTAIMVLEKGNPMRYPVPYTVWKKTVRGKSLRADLSLHEIEELTARRRFYAEPVDPTDSTSSWLTGRRRAIAAARKVLGKSAYKAHSGVNSGGANAVYWLDIIAERPDGLLVVSNVTKGAKRKVEEVQTVLEPDLVYPFLRGRDLRRWTAKPGVYMLVPHDPAIQQLRRRACPKMTCRESIRRPMHTWRGSRMSSVPGVHSDCSLRH